MRRGRVTWRAGARARASARGPTSVKDISAPRVFFWRASSVVVVIDDGSSSRRVVVVVPLDLRYHHRDISNIDHLRIARSSSVVVRRRRSFASSSSSTNPHPPWARTRLAFDFAHDARVVRGHVHITIRRHRCVIVRAFVRPGCVVHVSRHHASTHDVWDPASSSGARHM